MQVRVLGIYGYRGRFDYEWGESLPDPSWSDIEAALRRLDANEYAGVVLHQNDHREGEPATDYFSVTGGPDGYLVTCVLPGHRSVTIVDASKADGGEFVGVCRRDQGVWIPERKVCHDFEVVLAAAKYYAETGRPWPGVTWG
ncbi:MAG: hypothetical protein ACHRHE_12335 [Tepidisphaerales bacterium]